MNKKAMKVKQLRKLARKREKKGIFMQYAQKSPKNFVKNLYPKKRQRDCFLTANTL